LRQIIELQTQTKAILDDCINRCQALIDDGNAATAQQEQEEKLARQWLHALN
jgi:hypothetical protein